MKPFYITTTLPYVNSTPHVGFATELIRADVIARYKRARGFEVFFNTGTDEHGTKVFQRAVKEGKEAKQYVDEMAQNFIDLKGKLNLSFDKFIRTTDAEHIAGAQEFWKRCSDAGFIYKKKYNGTYCVGCEMFVTEKDLINGECPYHPGQKLETIEEENYFFKYSAFQNQLLKLYENSEFVVPASRLNEIKSFVSAGLEDFSISRLKTKMPWGISVPGDADHVMYVWFDALTNYITTLGWPNNAEKFEKFWMNGTPIQYCGKDNLQHQSARWQAMLMSVGLPTSNKIVVDGFILADGQKMSKSLGNVVDPIEIVNEYGTEALRYFVVRGLHPFEDSDFTKEKFKEAYNAHLANGLGNVASRVMKMAETHLDSPVAVSDVSIPVDFDNEVEKFNLQEAANGIWRVVAGIDEKIAETEPFKLVKVDKDAAVKIIAELVRELQKIALMLEPIMPETSAKILRAVEENKKPDSLFLRKE